VQQQSSDFCPVCRVWIPSGASDTHEQGARHQKISRAVLLAQTLKAELGELLKDKGGIAIAVHSIPVLSVDEEHSIAFSIINSGSQDRRLVAFASITQTDEFNRQAVTNVPVPAEKVTLISYKVQPKRAGTTDALIMFSFKGFKIARKVSISCGACSDFIFMTILLAVPMC